MNTTDYLPFWEKNPADFVNAEGVSWWLDKDATRYAQRQNQHGVSLPEARVFVVKRDSIVERVILSGNEVVYSSQSLEAICVHIDIMKVEKRFSDPREIR